jgi:hypothetical protein
MSLEEQPKYESNIEPNTTGGTERPATEVNFSASDMKLGQLEVHFAALKERVESERILKFWIVGTVLAILAGIVGGMTFYHNITKDYLDSYTKTEDAYYQELIKNSTISTKIQSCSSASTYYWQLKDCLNK